MEHSTLEPICVSNDRKSVPTIRNIISTLQKDDINKTVRVDLITNDLRDTDIQEYILRSYGNCLRFLQESSYAPITLVQECEKNALKHGNELKSSDQPLYTQVIDTFPPNSNSIWDEIDLLEGDPPHRGAVMRNHKFEPFWLAAEEAEWTGLWEKGVVKRWNKSDLLKNDRIFNIRYVYKA